jgi:ABC-type transport system involved in multi-copper enzyme maturation permease subunit
LTKPVSRERLFLFKLLGSLSILAGTNLLYTAALLILNRTAGHGSAPAGHAALAGSALFFTQTVILSAAVCTAVCLRRVRSVSGGAMTIAFGAFILTAVQHILEDEALRYALRWSISTFHWLFRRTF